MIRTEINGDVAFIIWDRPDSTVNTKDRLAIAAFALAVEAVLANPALKGAVIASAKRDFIVGADIDALYAVTTPDQADAMLVAVRHTLRRIETGGKVFVAALNGSALGGGLEVALACHRRVAADLPGTRLGMPEISLGIMPGAGGTQRLPRLIGLREALPLLMQGRPIDVARARELGLIDEVTEPAALAERATQIVRDTTLAVQPWDDKRFAMPGFEVQSAAGRALFMNAVTQARSGASRENQAPLALLAAVYHGCQRSIETGLLIEAEHFARLVPQPCAKAITRVTFIADRAARAAQSGAGFAGKRVAVVGAGFMGCGIARAAAEAGFGVRLFDHDADRAARGLQRIGEQLSELRDKGRITAQRMDTVMAAISTHADLAVVADCDIAVEAVFEDAALKARIHSALAAHLPPQAVLATNTSTLPISELARAAPAAAARFIGLHFFSPVDRMRLVEVIRGTQTADATATQAVAFVRKLGKRAVLVNDGAGFLTSRIFTRYLREALTMVAEGIAPARIDNAARGVGMPVGPLALIDETGIDLFKDIMRAQRGRPGALDFEAGTQADEEIAFVLDTAGRTGRRGGAGFYDYPDSGPKTLWSGLAARFPAALQQPRSEHIAERLMLVQTAEASRAVADGIVLQAIEADVASVLGWGFPAARGGVFGQMLFLGMDRFVASAERLRQSLGPRFALAPWIHEVHAGRRALYHF